MQPVFRAGLGDTKPHSKHKMYSSRIFLGTALGGKDGGLSTHNSHAEEAGRLDFYTKRLRAGIFKKIYGG